MDSSLYDKNLGRYSFLGYNPFFILKTKRKDPFFRMRQLFEKYKMKESFLPFLGGAVGFLSYDLGFVVEQKISRIIQADLEIPDCFFGFYSAGIVIDNLLSRLYIFSLGFPEKKYFLAKAWAKDNFEELKRVLDRIDFSSHKKFFYAKDKKEKGEKPQFFSNFTRHQYIQAIKKAKDYIRQGQIYQINLSQRLQVESNKSAFEVYAKLRNLSPAFYSAYLDGGDFQIISSSPEEFLRVKGNCVITRPMKGTRRRGRDKEQDQRLKKELLKSPKDKAELLMIVDLERNDLGKVCKYHSIKVEQLRKLERYATVFQTTSTIKGILHLEKDRFDLLRACFPGGSITGCPKIRAMQIIEELERSRRTFYTGSLGYLSFCGNMHFNILIRSILKKDNNFYLGVGGGIVADSSPEKEYTETIIKADAMLRALN